MQHRVLGLLALIFAPLDVFAQDESVRSELAFSKLVDGTWQVFLAEASGESVRQLTHGPSDHRSPAWSSDGEHLFYCDGEGRLYIDDLDGSGPAELIHPQAPLSSPALSKHGQVAYSRVRRAAAYQLEVWSSDTVGFGLQRLTRPGRRQQEPAWSPDGNRLAVGEYDPKQELFSLVVMDELGGDVQRIVESADRVGDPVWAPDGRSIVYVARHDRNYDLYVVDVESRETRRLTSDTAADRNPSLSPDGSEVIFTSRRSGETMLWRMPFDGGVPILLEACGHSCREPAWRPTRVWRLSDDAIRLGRRLMEPGETLRLHLTAGLELADPELEITRVDGTPVWRGSIAGAVDGALTWRASQGADRGSDVYLLSVHGVVDGEPRIWNPSRTTGGRYSPPMGLVLDASKRVVRFEIDEPCWTRVRLGGADGPLYDTPVHWTAFGSGAHEISIPGDMPAPWGSVWHQADLRVRVNTLTLPENAVILRPPEAALPRLLESTLSTDPIDARSLLLMDDPPVVCEIVQDRPTSGGGTPVLDDIAHLRVDTRDPRDRRFFEGSRFEILVYLDGQFLMEDEDSLLPFNYRLDVSRLSAGEHSFLVNVASDLGSVGVGFGSFVIE